MENPLFGNIKAGGGKETWIAVLGVSHQCGIDSWEVVLLAGVTTAGQFGVCDLPVFRPQVSLA